jgi:hypothetical protein
MISYAAAINDWKAPIGNDAPFDFALMKYVLEKAAIVRSQPRKNKAALSSKHRKTTGKLQGIAAWATNAMVIFE